MRHRKTLQGLHYGHVKQDLTGWRLSLRRDILSPSSYPRYGTCALINTGVHLRIVHGLPVKLSKTQGRPLAMIILSPYGWRGMILSREAILMLRPRNLRSCTSRRELT